MIYNVSIRTHSPGLIDFMYPEFIRVHEYSPFVESGVIYDGDPKYLQSFRDNDIKYIYTKGTPEYDLTIPENLIEFVYKKWDKTPPKSMLDHIKNISSDELETIAKQVWVTGKCSIEESDEERLSSIYRSLSSADTYGLIKEFLELSENINHKKLFFNISRFLRDATDPDSISVKYKMMSAKKFKENRGRYKNVTSSLMSFLYSPLDSEELKMLKLLDTLTTIKR